MAFKSGFIKTQMDYFLIRANNKRLCKDCKMILSEYIGTQHRLLVLDVEFKCSKSKKNSVGTPELNGGILLRRMLESHQRELLRKEFGGK